MYFVTYKKKLPCMSYVSFINESNKFSLNKPINSNGIYYSELNEWFTTNAFRNFSIKYVLEGVINYKANNKYYEVKAGSYLLASQQPFVNAYFESRQSTKSICIDIHPDTIAEAFSILTTKKDHDLDNYRAGYFASPHFYENVVPLEHSLIHTELNGFENSIKNAGHEITDEWFLNIVEKIILQEFPKYKSVNKVIAKKTSTKKEIFERLMMAQAFMDDQFLHNPGISEIASVANLSVFLFFRSFRQVFHMSPYQYLLNKRLNLALELIGQNQQRITDIATMLQFSDVQTFSKAFKRKYGVAPTRLK